MPASSTGGTATVVRVLEYIERYGDCEDFVQAWRLKQWLSPSISEESVS